MGMWIAIFALTVVVGIFGAVIYRQRGHARQLERLLAHSNEKLESLHLNFGRFTPEEVVEHLTDPDGSYAPNMRQVTVLFADLQDFTQMCSHLEPAQIISVLNGYFRCMSQVISRHHGQVTEILGDGLLALFGALRNNPWQTKDAALAALDMREALVKYNKELQARDLPQLKFGVGIHQGEVLAAVMGDFELSKFGVVGDAINVAARIESLTRQHGVDILVSAEVAQSLNDKFVLNEMAAATIKGKEKEVVTYHLASISH